MELEYSMNNVTISLLDQLSDGAPEPFHFGYVAYMEGTVSLGDLKKYSKEKWNDPEQESKIFLGWHSAESEIMDATDPSRLAAN
jgi:hypothetical protein